MESPDSMISKTELTYVMKRIIYICGAKGEQIHDSPVTAVVNNLMRDFFISIYNEEHIDHKETRRLLANAELMLFFVDQETTRNTDCLLILQYAWNSRVPVMMIKKPNTKFTPKIKTRTINQMDLVGNYAIMRTLNDKKTDNETVDLYRIMDILKKGFYLGVIYDPHDHESSMKKIKDAIWSVLNTMKDNSCENDDDTLMGSSKNDANVSERSATSSASSVKSKKKKMAKEVEERKEGRSTSMNAMDREEMRNRLPDPVLLQGNPFWRHSQPAEEVIRAMKAKEAVAAVTEALQESDDKMDEEEPKGKKLSHLIRKQLSQESDSSIERRMSLSSLDDKQYKKTQYMVFSVRDPAKKPRLVKCPEELEDPEKNTELSVWGLDTSLDEEVDLAEMLGGKLVQYDCEEGEHLESYATTPAPYISPL